MSDIMVSISCLAYNHEKYIRQALEGFVNQKTNFKYEVLIHDDASTDGTAEIIREYEEKYPDIIKPIYQTENQYSKKIGIQKTYQYPRAKGKYIALCEGDDYWCCETKLQEQFDIMEGNPNLILCTHKVRHITEDDSDLDMYYPSNKMPEHMTSEEFVKTLLKYNRHPFQTSSFFFKKETIMEKIKNPPEYDAFFNVGDISILWYMALNGEVYYIDKVFSKYRVAAQNSWSSKYSEDGKFQINFQNRMIKVFEGINKYTDYAYAELIEENINRCEFLIKKANGDTKSLLRPEYKTFRKEMSGKAKIKYILKAHFKPIYLFLKRMKNK